VIARNARLILITDVTILLSTVVSSLLGARALGPAGRGDLLVVVLWPPVVAMLAGLGLPSAYRYWMAREPEKVSPLFTNAVIYTAVVGIISVALADLIVPHLVGDRSHQVLLPHQPRRDEKARQRHVLRLLACEHLLQRVPGEDLALDQELAQSARSGVHARGIGVLPDDVEPPIGLRATR